MHTFAHSNTSCIHIILLHNHSQSLAACPPYLSHFEKRAAQVTNALWQSASVSMPLREDLLFSNVCLCKCVCVNVYVSWNVFPFFSLIPFKAAGGKHWQIYWSTLNLKAICHGLGWRIIGAWYTHDLVQKGQNAFSVNLIESKYWHVCTHQMDCTSWIVKEFFKKSI